MRQFIFEDEGEYEGMEQLALTLYFEPTEELKNLETSLWTYDCNSTDEFFQRVEGMDSFTIPIERYIPLRCEVYQGKV